MKDAACELKDPIKTLAWFREPLVPVVVKRFALDCLQQSHMSTESSVIYQQKSVPMEKEVLCNTSYAANG